jgi:hypothetical protein
VEESGQQLSADGRVCRMRRVPAAWFQGIDAFLPLPKETVTLHFILPA